MKTFKDCEGYARLTSFLFELNEACKTNVMATQSYVVYNLISYLEHLRGLIRTRFPARPVSSGSRFGNPAFRDWLDYVQSETPNRIKDAELVGYFCNSFGSWHRLDYGTGHELHFLCFMAILSQSVERDVLVLGDESIFSHTEDTPPSHSLNKVSLSELGIVLFPAYLRLTKALQAEYWLEPAGSHGVWGLDDYHFLPFLLGSAQLCHHPFLKPSSIHNDELLEELRGSYIYLDCIREVKQLKSGVSFAEHSPLLYDISGLPSWSKLNAGLLKMYHGEVLGKLPIMQHLLFGYYLKFEDGREEDLINLHTADHVHVAGIYTRGDCCGNPLPSMYAAQKKVPSAYLPFD